MVVRVAFQTDMRAGCIALVTAYSAAEGLGSQVYPARPLTLYPPVVFVDQINESPEYDGLRQRHPVLELVGVWGIFDTADAVAQRDAFVDGFLDYVTDNFGGAGAGNGLWINAVRDEPAFVPDWGSEAQRNTTYYATRFFMEGLSLGAN